MADGSNPLPWLRMFPPAVCFKDAEADTVYTAEVTLRNADSRPHAVKIIAPKSKRFHLVGDDFISVRLSPGLTTTFEVAFATDEENDFWDACVVQTEVGTAELPLAARAPSWRRRRRREPRPRRRRPRQRRLLHARRAKQRHAPRAVPRRVGPRVRRTGEDRTGLGDGGGRRLCREIPASRARPSNSARSTSSWTSPSTADASDDPSRSPRWSSRTRSNCSGTDRTPRAWKR